MTQLFHHPYYTLDLLVGSGLPFLLGALHLRGLLSTKMWRLFWVTELPAHYVVFMGAHTLWDGGIFLAGVAITRALCSAPHFQCFKLTELGVLLLWGQVSALLVELSSTFSEGWVYVRGYAWNPTLFLFNGHDITLLPQAIWAVAPIVFYVALLRVKP